MGISYGCIGKAKKLDCTGSSTPRISVKPRQDDNVSENNDQIENEEADKKEENALFVVNNEIGSPKLKRTMFAWMRLGHSGVDLTGTGGQLLEVTLAQLAQHNTNTDAWIALKGCVYNVTAYLDYHPGGKEELMKGVGTDATQLFNQVHKWVSYENILKKCLVGNLVESEEDEQTIYINNNNNITDEKVQDFMTEKTKVILNWTQNSEDVTVTLTTGWPQITRDRVAILKKNEALKIIYYLASDMKVFILLAAVCGAAHGAPQGTSSNNKQNTRFFNVNQGFQGQQFPGQQFPIGGGQQFPGQQFPIGGGQQFPGQQFPIPNTQVNVVQPGPLGPTVVGVPVQQCSKFCRGANGQYQCCDILGIQRNQGQCPTPRPSCPPTRLFGQGPRSCSTDKDCYDTEKCCYDTCLRETVCKPPTFGQQQFGQFGGQFGR